MWISIKILVLLWLINLTPPMIAHYLKDKWNTPIDKGRLFRDGNPLLGSHKTLRGFLGGMITGVFVGLPVSGFRSCSTCTMETVEAPRHSPKDFSFPSQDVF